MEENANNNINNNNIKIENTQSRINEAKSFFDLLYSPVKECKYSYLWLKKGELKRTIPFDVSKSENRAEMARQAIKHSDEGYDVFFGVCLTDKPPVSPNRAKYEDITMQVATWTDIDTEGGTHINDEEKGKIYPPNFNTAKSFLPAKASILTNSSYGLHGYKRYTVPLVINDDNRESARKRNKEYINIVKRNAGKFEGVDSVQDLTRVLRVPGTYNYKLGKENAPLCHIVEVNDITYSTDEIDKLIEDNRDHQLYNTLIENPADKISTAHMRNHYSNNNYEYERARAIRMLDFIDADDYEIWIRVGMCLYDIGCSVHDWDNWSKKSSKYKVGECLKKWNTFNGGGNTEAAIGNLCNMAKASGYDDKTFYHEWHNIHKTKQISTDKTNFDCPLPYDKIKLPKKLKFDIAQKITKEIDDTEEKTKFNSIMIISKRFKNLDNNLEKIEISILKPYEQNWKNFTTERRNIASRTRIVDLASLGLDVTSTRAAQVVNYLDAFEVLNSNIIPNIYTVSTTGWRNNNEFVYPNTSNEKYELDDTIKPQLDKIFTIHGNKTPVINLLKKHINKDITFAVIGTALVAPLVKIFRCPNIALHTYANTGSGKSTLNKLALSLFADPNSTGALPTADATRAGLEYYFAGRHDLPAIIEDIDGVNDDKSKKVIATLPYQFVNNTGRLRAKKTGGNDTILDFSGSLITNGEHPLTTDTSSGGGKRRVMEIKGEDKIFSDEEAREIYSIIEENYGLFGRDWIEYIKNHKEEMKNDYINITRGEEGLFKEFTNKIPLHISNMAAIMTASVHFYKNFLGIDEDRAFNMALDSTRRILQILPNEVEIADYIRSKEYIRDWIDSHPKNFMQPVPSEDGKFIDAQAEAYETFGVIRDTYVAIYPSTFKEMLTGYNFSAEMITKQLADSGFITRGDRNNIAKLIKFNNKPKRMIIIGKDKLYSDT